MTDTLKSCPSTLNTTRICANDELDASIEISKIGFNNMNPNAVILVNKDEVFDGIVATSLVHFPINASLLFTDGNRLSEKTLGEIERLSPKGYNGVQVILVGNISKNVSLVLNDHGYRTKHISGRNYYETAGIISRIRKEFDNILIISGEDYSEGIIAGYWSAHHGDPILFVQRNRIPNCTIDIIKKMNDINIYIVGSTKTISKDVEYYLSGLDNVKKVDRIGGESPYEIAVNFSRYNDEKADFGWGRNYRGGHAFTFGKLDEPMKIIASVVFAHMGKHTPLLLIEKDKIPEVVNRYINLIKPIQPKGMLRPPFMHGFILGDISNISYKAQKMIEGILSIDQHMMNNENMEGMTGKMKDNVMNADKKNMMMNNGMQDMNENIKNDSIYGRDYIFEWRNLCYRKVNVDEIL